MMAAFAVSVFGQETDGEYLPQEMQEFAQQADGFSQWLEQSPFGILQDGWQAFSQMATNPLWAFLKIAVFLLLAGVVCTPSDTGEKPFFSVMETVCFLMCAVLCVQPIQQLIEQTYQQILYCKGALLGFVPVFSSMLVTSGQPASAALFSGFFMSTALMLSEIAANIVLPLIQVLMALHTASGVSGVSIVSSVAQLVQKSIKWMLGFVATVFGTFLGLQSFLAGTSDSFLMKTGKFLISSSIPIVGQAVSGTVSAVSAGMKLAQGTAAVGLLVTIGLCFVPVLVQTVLYWAVFSGASAIAKGVQQNRCAAVLKATAGCVSLCGVTLLFYGLPIVLSVVWMMTAG